MPIKIYQHTKTIKAIEYTQCDKRKRKLNKIHGTKIILSGPCPRIMALIMPIFKPHMTHSTEHIQPDFPVTGQPCASTFSDSSQQLYISTLYCHTVTQNYIKKKYQIKFSFSSVSLAHTSLLSNHLMMIYFSITCIIFKGIVLVKCASLLFL